MWLRKYDDETALARQLKISRITLRKWIWLIVPSLADQVDKFIIWAKRKRNTNASTWCWISVDGTDFRINEPTPFSSGWYSHKYKAAGVRYEIGICIGSGDIVWVNGPFPCGKWPDLKIFRENGLKDALEPGEMVEADNGYRGEPKHIRIKDDYHSKMERKEKERIRARHETVNRRFKQFKILHDVFRHNLKLHRHVFRAVVVLTQIEIDCGNTPFAAWQDTVRPRIYNR